MEEQQAPPAPRKTFKENFLLMMVLWKFRLQCPDFTLIVTEKDKAEFDASLKFQEQVPVIKVEEVRAGLRIRMEDGKTGNNITTTESSEEKYDAGKKAKKFRDAIASIPGLLVDQQKQEAANVFTSTDLQALLRTLHETAPVV